MTSFRRTFAALACLGALSTAVAAPATSPVASTAALVGVPGQPNYIVGTPTDPEQLAAMKRVQAARAGQSPEQRMSQQARSTGLAVQTARLCGILDEKMEGATQWYKATRNWYAVLEKQVAKPGVAKANGLTVAAFDAAFLEGVNSRATKGKPSDQDCTVLKSSWPSRDRMMLMQAQQYALAEVQLKKMEADYAKGVVPAAK